MNEIWNKKKKKRMIWKMEVILKIDELKNKMENEKRNEKWNEKWDEMKLKNEMNWRMKRNEK